MESVDLETSVVGYLASRPSNDVVVAGARQLVTRQWWSGIVIACGSFGGMIIGSIEKRIFAKSVFGRVAHLADPEIAKTKANTE